MSSPDQTVSPPLEDTDVPDPVPAVEAPLARAVASVPERRAAKEDVFAVVVLVLISAPFVVALVLLLVVLPIRDGMKTQDSAREAYAELYSLSSGAGWRTDSEIRSVQTSLDGDVFSLDSGLWSVGFDLGSLAYEVGAELRPNVRQLEDAIDARRDELEQLRRSADARFDQLRESVEERLGGIEDAARAASDGDWDESSRQFSRDSRIIQAAMWMVVLVLVASVVVGLWASWRDRRSLAQPAEGM